MVELLHFGRKMGIAFNSLEPSSLCFVTNVSDERTVPRLELNDLSKAKKVEWPYEELSRDIYDAGMVMLCLWEGRLLAEKNGLCSLPLESM